MPRLAAKKKPLRGSVRQNRAGAAPEEAPKSRMTFGMRLALLVLGTIMGILLISWVWHSQWPRAIGRYTVMLAINATREIGFAVSDVTVQGRHHTERSELFAALNVRAGDPIFTFDPQRAYDNIARLPWTEKVVVIRSLPNKIIIKLTERQPIARWQHDGQISVIDASGFEIPAAQVDLFAHLPLVVGNAAPEQTQALLTTLNDFPTVAQMLKAAVRVGQRRWNLYIRPNLLIRLPEENVEKALTKLSVLIQEGKIAAQDIKAVDLRLPDRMTIEPGQQPETPSYGETAE